MATIVKSKTEALKVAKQELRISLGTKRLTSVINEKPYGAVMCDCGHAAFVKLTGFHGKASDTAIVGFCKICGQ